MANILIIDDDALLCESLEDLLARQGHRATSVNSISAARIKCREEEYDIVFLDVRLPDGDGLTIIPELKKTTFDPEIIIITGQGDRDGVEIAIKSGAWCYLEKTSITRELTLPLIRALEYREEKKRRTPSVLIQRDQIVGSSPRLTRCLELLADAAGSDVNALITGETGTGKEIFAHTIHRNSSRVHSGGFVVVDCASLTETLVESILFGHVRGAFSGAEMTRDGLVLQANRGTLFLDEVGELPLNIQKSFLRVLQERTFRPVGDSTEKKSDFRLIAATNRDLDGMARRGKFRKDLLYRLRSLVIELPPLRERGEDILELARYYVNVLCLKYGRQQKEFSPEFIEALNSYGWPGNIRELFHALDRAFATAVDSTTLHTSHLPEGIRIDLARSSISRNRWRAREARKITPEPLPSWKQYREQAEYEYLRRLVEETGFDVASACRTSGLSRARLYQLFRKYGLQNDCGVRKKSRNRRDSVVTR